MIIDMNDITYDYGSIYKQTKDKSIHPYPIHPSAHPSMHAYLLACLLAYLLKYIYTYKRIYRHT